MGTKPIGDEAVMLGICIMQWGLVARYKILGVSNF